MGQLIIPPSAIVYADTSIFIYTVEENLDYYSLLQPLWSLFQAGEVEIISSELTLMETLVAPLRDAKADLVNTYEQLLLSSSIQLISISQRILRQAAQLRAITSLKTPDAIHAATALSQNCSVFLTNDRGFRDVLDLPIIILKDVFVS